MRESIAEARAIVTFGGAVYEQIAGTIGGQVDTFLRQFRTHFTGKEHEEFYEDVNVDLDPGMVFDVLEGREWNGMPPNLIEEALYSEGEEKLHLQIRGIGLIHLSSSNGDVILDCRDHDYSLRVYHYDIFEIWKPRSYFDKMATVLQVLEFLQALSEAHGESSQTAAATSQPA